MFKIFASSCSHSAFAICKGGIVYAWGVNSRGQLGIGNHDRTIVPREVEFSNPVEIDTIAHGILHSVFLTCDGDMYSCGSNDVNGFSHDAGGFIAKPKLHKFSTDVRVVEVSCGFSHTLILTQEGGVLGFGESTHGQLGSLDLDKSDMHREVRRVELGDEGSVRVKKVSCGGNHSVCMTSIGVLGFGSNSYGQLGLPDPIPYFSPAKIPISDFEGIIDIQCGITFTILLLIGGNILFLGRGDSRLATPCAPRLIRISSTDVLSVSCGFSHFAVTFADGKMYGFYEKTNGEIIGEPLNGASSTNPFLFGPLSTQFVDIICGYLCSFLVDRFGILYAYGKNTYGQLGLGNLNFASRPLKVPLGGGNRISILKRDLKKLDLLEASLEKDLCQNIIECQP